jgi:hypothetical protein
MKRLAFLALLPVVLGAFAVAWLADGAGAATGPCGTNHDAMDAEEYELIGLVEQWRAANLPYTTPLEPSGALAAAAAWHAEYLATHTSGGGHLDGYGRNWVDRELDCGYSGATSGGIPYAYGSGEAVFALSGSFPLDIGPAEALQGLTYSGSGLHITTPSQSLPAKCVGVGVFRETGGTSVAWVVLIAQYPASMPCPGSTGISTSPTASPTPSPTPTVTPTPTPDEHKTYVPGLRQSGQ